METTAATARKLLKPRNPGSRKGQNDRVLVIGGSKDYYGSPALVAAAALRSGADLAYLLVPAKIAPTVAGYLPDLIVREYEGNYLTELAFQQLNELQNKADVLVIGNGLTKKPVVLQAIQQITSFWQKPIVIDADAIMPGLRPASKHVVYTPHVVEFERLLGSPPSQTQGKREKQVAALAKKLNATILLKGRTDVISNGKTTFYNKTGNAGMTSGGTGDTLAGVCAALLAQGHEPVVAAALAAYLNGAAGDLAFKKYGNCLIASDIPKELPQAIKAISRK
jgi:hydroxyethylthiazole kinase-like uncharacterized protein yjeF